MQTRPLYEIAREIAARWPTASPHAKAYLKAMHYLVDIEDSFAAGHARKVVRSFLLYSKEWQGDVAERVKAELRELSKQPEGAATDRPGGNAVRRGVPGVCELCTLQIRDKFVHGHSVWGVLARMCPACHYYIGVGFEKGDGALYQCQADGRWRRLHGTPPRGVGPALRTVLAWARGLAARLLGRRPAAGSSGQRAAA
jgi:hypothetical protein